MNSLILTWAEAAALDPGKRSVKYLRALCKREWRAKRIALHFGGPTRKHATGIPLRDFERMVARGTLVGPPVSVGSKKAK